MRGCPGHLAVRFVDFHSHKWKHIQIPSKSGKYDFELEAIKVNLGDAVMSVDRESSDVAQNLCLAFSISVLQVRNIHTQSRTGTHRYTQVHTGTHISSTEPSDIIYQCDV